MCSSESLLICRISQPQLRELTQKLNSTMKNDENKINYLYRANLCMHCKRFQDMLQYIRLATESNSQVEDEELHLISLAYKNLVKEKRAQYNTLSTILEDEAGNINQRQKSIAEGLKNKISNEIRKLCAEVVTLIDRNIIPRSRELENKICAMMIKGDHYRYLAEISPEELKSEYAAQALKTYDDAFEVSKLRLTSTNPLRLNLALNLSVLYYEIFNSPSRACSVAKQAFDEAIFEVENLNEENFKNATKVMKLLTDNLSLWETGRTENAGHDDDD